MISLESYYLCIYLCSCWIIFLNKEKKLILYKITVVQNETQINFEFAQTNICIELERYHENN